MSVESPRSSAAPVCVVALVMFSGVLFARSAAVLPFWFDESLTVRLSRLEPAQLWRALTAGIELNPPLIYLLTKVARALPGPETLTARLPGLCGYVLLVGSLYVFMRRRIGPWYAVCAVALLPLADYTVRYTVEARAYMAVLGVSAVALVCWQALADRFSWRAAAGLAVSTASALALHVWAILLPMALLAGEAVEAFRTGRPRWRVLLSLAAASPPLIVYPSLVRTSKSIIFGGPVYAPTPDKLAAAFRSDLPRLRIMVMLTIVACVMGWWQTRRNNRPVTHGPNGFNAAELTALGCLLLSPLVPYGYATVAKGAFMTRYALFALPAIVSVIGALLFAVGRGRDLSGQSAAVLSLLGVLLLLPPKVPLVGRPADVLTVVRGMNPRLDPSGPARTGQSNRCHGR